MKPQTNTFHCQALLLDLDGVLIDSSACIVRHWKYWADKHGLDLETIMQAAHGKRTIDTMKIIAPFLDLEAEEREFTHREVEDVDGISAIPGSLTLLESLPTRQWTIVTSAGEALARSRLSAANLPIPTAMVTADLVQNGKPDPQGYLMGSRLLGVPPEDCIVLEDAPAGIQAGKAAGMRVIAIASTHPPRELLEADLVIPALTSLQVLKNKDTGELFSLHIQPDNV
ncbi:MAG: HAD family hydrolase [Anaerolineales bacterium]|nr:HAD family hydrolase [Anaerolineales bacterium]